MKKIYLFDFDGVFWDSEYIWVGSLCYLIDFFGKQIDEDEAFCLFAGTSIETKKEIMLERFDIDISTPENKKMLQDKEEEVKRSVSLTIGMEQIFQYLNNCDKKQYIVTGAPRKAVLEKIRRWGLEEYFSEENIITSKDVEVMGGKGKPAPDIYLYAAKKAGVNPDGCVVIEDSKQGITAGLAAGMTVIAYIEHQKQRLEMAKWATSQGVVLLASNSEELFARLESL